MIFSWGICLQDIFSPSNILHEIFFRVDGIGEVGLHYKSNYKGSVKESLKKYVNFPPKRLLTPYNAVHLF